MSLAPGSLLGVTGASGRIGRHFCKEALRRGYRVRGFGRSTCDIEGVESVQFDLGSTVEPGTFDGCKALVHLAAYIPKDHRSPEEGARCWAVNVLGTVRLIEAAAAGGVRRVVQTSSANAYAPWSGRTDEEAPLFPTSRTYYLGSKIVQELAAGEVSRAAGVELATLRLSTVYGPDPEFGLLATLAARVLAGETIELADEGRFGADFVHVDDVVSAMFLVVEAGGEGPFNVASGERTTLAELVEQLTRMTGRPADVQLIPGRGDVDEGFPAIDISRLTKLGYDPRSLADGLEELVESLSNTLSRAG